jgi:hypothetical protein
MSLVAHGIGTVKDLPVPTWLFYWGAAGVLLLSFGALGSLWRKPLLERHAQGRPAPAWLGRIVLARGLRVAVQTISVLLFVLVFATALEGSSDPNKILAPTWIYIVFWLGVPLLSVLFGNVWTVLSPWRAMADGYVWLSARLGRPPSPVEPYPERLGRWPAALGLFAFVALELAYKEPSSPFALAFATMLYTIWTLFGYATFGRATWQVRGEAFAVAFAYFARMAPLTVADGRLRFRWPFTGLAGAEPVPGSLAVVAVMLGSVGFDGLSRTSSWQNLLADVEDPFVPGHLGLGDLVVMLVNLAGLVGLILLVAGAYRLTVSLMASSVGMRRSLAPDFLLSLVPIAFVYAVAHYFSLFVIQGQYVILLLSDPFGRGWDLLGTADYEPNLQPFAPETIWYVQAGALVAGHVVGLAVAHDRAVTLFRTRDDALRSQYAMLALMVLYTVGGLWLLSRG